ncbi:MULTISPECIES: hypothetical protein [unclassified Streptomyces]|uniref:hypothetical protein n=1 Tax=unclassified Streptomyces TaxID=2593676 RepID=UPI00382BB5AB
MYAYELHQYRSAELIRRADEQRLALEAARARRAARHETTRRTAARPSDPTRREVIPESEPSRHTTAPESEPARPRRLGFFRTT